MSEREAIQLGRRLADFVVNTKPDVIPQKYLDQVCMACFDGLGVMLAGAAEPVGQVMQRFLREHGGHGEATVAGTTLSTAVTDAALANGTFAHAEDFDDQGGHFSCYLLPALLVLGEKLHASGKDLVVAYAMGVESAKAVRRAGKYHQTERGFHSMMVHGNVAVAAACSRVAGLSVEETAAALGVACSGGCGVVQDFGSMGKPLHAGMLARTGVTAALLAREGFRASEEALDGPVGYLQAYLGTCDGTEVAAYLENAFQHPPIEGIKKYPCCGSNHSAIDAVLNLRREHQFAFEDVERVEVSKVPYLSHILLYPEPLTGLQGKFSLRYTVAVATLEGDVTREAFTDAKVADPRLQEAMAKVDLRLTSKWEPKEGRAASNPVRVFLKDGRVLQAAVDRFHGRGSVWSPLTESELQAKFTSNATRSLSEAQAREVLQVWRDPRAIEELPQAVQLLKPW